MQPADVDHREAGVAGAEPAVLEVALGDRDVHLAGPGDERAVGRDADRGVEAEAGDRRLGRRAPRRATRARRHRSRRRTPPRTGGCGHRRAPRVASVVVGPGVGDREVRRQGELGEAHESRARLGCGAHPGRERGLVGLGIGVEPHLHRADAEPTAAVRRPAPTPRGRARGLERGDQHVCMSGPAG